MLEEAPGRGPAGTQTGPEGWVPDVPGRYADPHPLQPRWGFRGPLRWDLLRFRVGRPRCWTRYYPPGIPLPLPTRYTRPGRTHPADERVPEGGTLVKHAFWDTCRRT